MKSKDLLIAFAKLNKVVYGKAFGIIKITTVATVDLNDLADVERNLNNITIYEVKSTNKQGIKEHFDKYFFGLSTAELLVAQNLRGHFKFIFVNVNTRETIELSLEQIFEKAKGVYPVWSIQFGKPI